MLQVIGTLHSDSSDHNKQGALFTHSAQVCTAEYCYHSCCNETVSIKQAHSHVESVISATSAKRVAGTNEVDFNDACGEESENVHFKAELLVMSPVVFTHNNQTNCWST